MKAFKKHLCQGKQSRAPDMLSVTRLTLRVGIYAHICQRNTVSSLCEKAKSVCYRNKFSGVRVQKQLNNLAKFYFTGTSLRSQRLILPRVWLKNSTFITLKTKSRLFVRGWCWRTGSRKQAIQMFHTYRLQLKVFAASGKRQWQR